MASLELNINQVNSDFNGIKNAITAKGVEIVSGTATSEYANKVNEVYEAGQSSMVDGSKIIEKTVTGKLLWINDVSEIPHDVSVRLTSDTITDFSGITVTKNGLNLFDPIAAYVESPVLDYSWVDLDYTVNDDGTVTAETISGDTRAWGYDQSNVKLFLPAGNYYFGIKPVSEQWATGGYSIYSRNGAVVKLLGTNNYTTGTWFKLDEADYVGFLTKLYTGTYKIMLWCGSYARKWEPYKKETFAAKSDGTVEGLRLDYKHNIITADNTEVDIVCSYHKSWGSQMAYDNQWDAIQQCGMQTNYMSAFGQSFKDDNFLPKYDMRPGNLSNCFQYTYIVDLEECIRKAGIVFDTSQVTTFGCTFTGSSYLTVIPILDTTSCNNLNYTFYTAYALKTIRKLILRDDGSQIFSSTFVQASSLQDILIEGVIGNNMSLSYSTKLSKLSINSIISHLSDTATEKTLTLSKTAVNNAFKTASGMADGSTSTEWLNLVATKPNWTISLS